MATPEELHGEPHSIALHARAVNDLMSGAAVGRARTSDMFLPLRASSSNHQDRPNSSHTSILVRMSVARQVPSLGINTGLNRSFAWTPHVANLEQMFKNLDISEQAVRERRPGSND